MSRKSAGALWREAWFRKLPAAYKLAWRFMLDEADHCGRVAVDLDLWQFILGYNPPLNWDNFFKAIDPQIQRLHTGEIWIPQSVVDRCGAITWDCPAHRTVIDFLREHDLLSDPRIKVVKVEGVRREPVKPKAVPVLPEVVPAVGESVPPRKKRTVKPRAPFVPPTVEQVEAYCRERKNGINATRFWAFYEANGWVQKAGKPIVNWKAAVITWEKDRQEDPDPVAKTQEILKSVASDAERRKEPERHGVGLLGEAIK